MLTEEYEKHIQRLEQKELEGEGTKEEGEEMGDKVKYEYFDFHEACQGEQFQHSNELVDKL